MRVGLTTERIPRRGYAREYYIFASEGRVFVTADSIFRAALIK
jgi:hypothetical protein